MITVFFFCKPLWNLVKKVLHKVYYCYLLITILLLIIFNMNRDKQGCCDPATQLAEDIQGRDDQPHM